MSPEPTPLPERPNENQPYLPELTEETATPQQGLNLDTTSGGKLDILGSESSAVSSPPPLKTQEQEKVPLGFFKFFVTLTFLSGISLGLFGSLVTRTETVKRIENGKVVEEVQVVKQGDGLTQGAGYGMAGLAAGTVFFSYAPGLLLKTVEVVGSVVAGAITKRDNRGQGGNDNA